jgi:hypothetical protein
MAIEDFSTYTETDPNSKIAVTSSKIDVSAIDRGDNAYVYDDKGSNFFDGDFEFLFEGYIDSATTNGYHAMACALANVNNKVSTDTNDDQGIRMYREGSASRFLVQEQDGSNGYQTSTGDLSLDTLYYLTLERDEAVGTYGTLYLYTYSDSDRTTLEGSASVALHSSKKDFRYIYGWTNRGDGSGSPWTGYVQDLDLQGSVAYTSTVADGLSLGDVLAHTFDATITQADSVSLSDSSSFVSTFAKAITEAFTLSDSIDATILIPISVTEAITLSDSKALVSTFTKTISDALSLSDVVTTIKGLTATISESISLSDSTSLLVTITLVVSESITLADSILKGGWSWLSKATDTTWTYITKNTP